MQGNKIPYSLLSGKINIGDVEVECHILSDYRRVFTQTEMVRVISGGRQSGNLQGYINTNPMLNKDILAGNGIEFKIPKNPTNAIGSEATLLIDIATAYVAADEKNLLKHNQKHLAVQSRMLVSASAKLGIIALVDEATGYQKIRKENALQIKFKFLLREEMQEWAQLFPSEFWIQLARLEGIDYTPKSRPWRWGKYVIAFVYEAVDKEISNEIRKRTPDPHFRNNLHLWFTEPMRNSVKEHIGKVIVVMKLCKDMPDFKRKFKTVFQKHLHEQGEFLEFLDY